MRRRAVLGACAAAGVIAAVACADLGGLSGAADVPEAGAEGSTDAAAPDGAIALDPDASTRTDATARVDASGCTTCDCDQDSFGMTDGGCAASEAGADCDDSDPLIRPGAPFAALPWTSAHVPAGDWDCSGVAVKQFNVNVSCSSPMVGCSLEGFAGDPACGALADYVKCTSAGLGSCTAVKIDTRRQGCK